MEFSFPEFYNIALSRYVAIDIQFKAPIDNELMQLPTYIKI